MTMTPRLRKFALTTHIIASVGWTGAVAAYIALDVAAATRQDAQTLRGAYLAMELIARYVIVPLASASLLTGLVMSLGTKWGLFRHYWVLEPFSEELLGQGIAAVAKPGAGIVRGDRRKTRGDGVLTRGPGPRPGVPQRGLELAEGVFDGREVGRIRRQEADVAAVHGDELTNREILVNAQIV